MKNEALFHKFHEKRIRHMSKRLFFLFAFMFFVFCANAQDETDECNCEETTIKGEAFKSLCSFHGTDEFGNPIDYDDALTITIRYEMIVCGDLIRVRVTSILISDALYNFHNLGYDPDPETMGCPYYPYPDGSDPQALNAWLADLYYEMLPSTNTNQIVISFPAGCQALVTATWPAGTKYTITDDGGPKEVDLSNTRYIYMVPCEGTECCVAEFTDEGQIIYRPIKASACDGAEPNVGPAPFVTYTDADGNVTVFEADITEVGPCMPMCYEEGTRGAFITSDASTGENVFSANPTLVRDRIWFNSYSPVTQVEVYDTQGKKVMEIQTEHNEINTSMLKPGMYLMQVRLANKRTRAVKIYKQ